MNTRKIRGFFHECLHDPINIKSRLINGALSFLVVFSIAVIPLHFLPDIEWFHPTLFLFDQVTVTIFTVEYFLRMWSDRRPLRFIFSWEGIVDLVAILPFYLAQLGILASFEVFLMLRILRILKFTTMYGFEQQALQRCSKKRHGKFYALPHEYVEQVVQKHPIIFLAGLVLPLFFTSAGLTVLVFFRASTLASAFTILCFFFAGVFFVRAWLNYHYDVIYITNYRVIVQNHQLFGSSINAIVYQAITNVEPDNTGFWRWVLGIGDVHIETAAMEGTLTIQNIQHPHKVVRKIAENRQKTFKHQRRKLLES